MLTNCVFLMMHQLGLAGLLRRTADPYAVDMFAHLRPVNVFITWSAIGLFAWQSFFVANLVWTWWRARAPAESVANPWRAASLEWAPAGTALAVVRGPYEYADPSAPEDWQPQSEVPFDAGASAVHRVSSPPSK